MRGVRLLRPPPIVPVDAENKTAIAQKVRGRTNSNGCGFVEVAPDKFRMLDCNNYTPVQKAKLITNPSRLLGLFKNKQLKLDPKPRGSAMNTGGGGPGGLLRTPPPTPPGERNSYPAGEGESPDYPSSEGEEPSGSNTELPETVDHRSEGIEGPVYDQGSVGSCTAFSLASTMNNAILRQNSKDAMSPLHVWSYYGEPDMGFAGDNTINKPIADNAHWPYSGAQACKLSRGKLYGLDGCGDAYGVKENTFGSDPAIQAKMKSSAEAAKWKITEIDAFQFNGDLDVFAALLATGRDFWLSFSINNWNGAKAPHWIQPHWGGPTGGHAVSLAGYKKNPTGPGRIWLIHNSWGTDWADKGYHWITDQSFKAYFRRAYVIKVESTVAPPPPKPPPPPPPPPADGACKAGTGKNPYNQADPNCYTSCTPGGAASQCSQVGYECNAGAKLCMPAWKEVELTDDDCGWDEMVDAVTGECALICPDDSRPADGCQSGEWLKRKKARGGR
jgi:hypothetical protein